MSVTEFQSHCLRLLEDASRTGESTEIFKRGKRVATVIPAASEIDYRPGQFKDSVKIVGDILDDVKELGIEWEAMH